MNIYNESVTFDNHLNAIAWAKGIVWDEIETTKQTLKDYEEIERFEGVAVLYNPIADSYAFQDLTDEWQAQDQTDAKLMGEIEFQDINDEYHHFTLVKTDTHIIFGTMCNIGLLESGNYLIDHSFTLDENLQELMADLESYYNDGKGYQSDDFKCNERM